MDIFSIVATLISSIIAILSISLTMITFSKNTTKDRIKEQQTQNQESLDIKLRLIKIETDINYIRQSLDENKNWQKEIEHRITNIELKEGGIQ